MLRSCISFAEFFPINSTFMETPLHRSVLVLSSQGPKPVFWVRLKTDTENKNGLNVQANNKTNQKLKRFLLVLLSDFFHECVRLNWELSPFILRSHLRDPHFFQKMLSFQYNNNKYDNTFWKKCLDAFRLRRRQEK